jgi:hypothetical protein
LKNWMQKDKDKWFLDHLLWKKQNIPWWNDPYHAQVHYAPPCPLE